jgi:hypothetical protein
VSNFRKLSGGDWGWKRGDVEFRADHIVEIADSADGGGFVVSDGDDEEFFCAENDFYGVKAYLIGSKVKSISAPTM